MPNWLSCWSDNMPWSVVSSAALRSRNRRSEVEFASKVSKMSFTTLARAAAVESSSWLLYRKSEGCWDTTLSKTSEKKGRLDTGLWLFRDLGLRCCFWSRGSTTADLKLAWTTINNIWYCRYWCWTSILKQFWWKGVQGTSSWYLNGVLRV